jgi:hypothetical protein
VDDAREGWLRHHKDLRAGTGERALGKTDPTATFRVCLSLEEAIWAGSDM